MVSAAVKAALIQKTEIFAGLSKEDIGFIISHSGDIELKKGEYLFSTGETAKHFFILISGVIRVYKDRNDGGKDEMAMFAAGDTIGDFDFARGAQYDASAIAAEDAALIVFPDTNITMDNISEEEPGAGCSILLNAIVLMTGRIKSIQKLILENMSWVQELHRQAYEDTGTGLWKQTLINDEIKNVLNCPSALIMIKPDRFKILVDSRGHSTGDSAMIKIAMILKNMNRLYKHSWPLRFKSNEVGIIINDCDSSQAEKIAKQLAEEIAGLEPVPAVLSSVPDTIEEIPAFIFSATVSWAVWPEDNPDWESFFQGNYASLLDTWKCGGDKIVRYHKEEKL